MQDQDKFKLINMLNEGYERCKIQDLNLREFMGMSNERLLAEASKSGVRAESARWELEIRKINRIHRLNLRVALISACVGFVFGIISSLITAYMIQNAAAPAANATQNQNQLK